MVEILIKASYTVMDNSGAMGFNVYFDQETYHNMGRPALCKWESYANGELVIYLNKQFPNDANVRAINRHHEDQHVTRFHEFDVDFGMTIRAKDVLAKVEATRDNGHKLTLVLDEEFWSNPKPRQKRKGVPDYDPKLALLYLNSWLSEQNDIVPEISDGQVVLYRRVVNMERL